MGKAGPWPDRLVVGAIVAVGVAVTVLHQHPKGMGLYADFWFGALVTLGLVMGYAVVKRALGWPPIRLRRGAAP